MQYARVGLEPGESGDESRDVSMMVMFEMDPLDISIGGVAYMPELSSSMQLYLSTPTICTVLPLTSICSSYVPGMTITVPPSATAPQASPMLVNSPFLSTMICMASWARRVRAYRSMADFLAPKKRIDARASAGVSVESEDV